MLIDQKVAESAYKQVELMLKEAVSSAKTETEFKENLGRLQLVGQRMLAIMVFNSCFGTKQSPFDLLETVGLGIKRELEQIVEAAKEGQEYLTSMDHQLHPESSETPSNIDA